MQFARATHAAFTAEFQDQDGEALPCADPETYPSVVIKDPQNTTVATGVGKPVGGGEYQFEWFVPEDAEINTHDHPWSIEWFFVTATGHNKDQEESFDVVDRIEIEPEERKWTYLTRANTSERLFLKLDILPEELGVELLGPTDTPLMHVQGITEEVSLATPSTAVGARKIGYMKKDGLYNFFVDSDPLGVGEYLVFWNSRKDIVSPIDHVQQMLRVPNMTFWHMAQPLRMLIDKLQKKVGWVQAYSDSDLYEYILRGIDMTNQVQPTTNWTMETVPRTGSRGVFSAILLYAAVWGLTAQNILDTELQFDFGGQTVTLTYNHDYGGVLGNINELLGKFAESKQHIYRIAHGPGRVGVRPKNWRFTQRVWRVDNWGFGSPYDVSVLMTSVGL
jgi:hypothetical protein